MHADGRIVSGARAFAALWAGLPAFSILGRLSQRAVPAALLEVGYRLFLRVRPWLQRRLRSTRTMAADAPVANCTTRQPGSYRAQER